MARPEDVIKVAKSQVGYREKPVNRTKYATDMRELAWSYGQPWCHVFISWVFRQAKAEGLAPVTASCLSGAAWFDRRKRLSQTPRAGDVVYYGPRGGTHVELVTAVTPTHITTIGGNTSGRASDGRYHEGDGVYEKEVPRNSPRIHGYGRPAYETDATPVVLAKAKPKAKPKPKPKPKAKPKPKPADVPPVVIKPQGAK